MILDTLAAIRQTRFVRFKVKKQKKWHNEKKCYKFKPLLLLAKLFKFTSIYFVATAAISTVRIVNDTYTFAIVVVFDLPIHNFYSYINRAQ